MISDPGAASLGRFIVGTLPRGQLQQLGVVAFSLFALGGIVWIGLSWSRMGLLSKLRFADREPDEFGISTTSSNWEPAIIPLTSILLILGVLTIGSRAFGDGVFIRSPEVALAAIGTDYVSVFEVVQMTLGLFGKAVVASLFAAFLGYVLAMTLPKSLLPLQLGMLGSAFAVQIIPIVVIAALLWIVAPDLLYRDIVVATLSGLYPAFQLMQERRAQIPVMVREFLLVRSFNRSRGEFIVYIPWAIAAIPTVVLAVAPFAVNAVLASEYILMGDGIGRWLYAINARGETTMVYGFFLLITSCSLFAVSLLIMARQFTERRVAGGISTADSSAPSASIPS